ncbi:16S rRNA (guanine(527)-N(7))-methyltransferase RsmG [Marinobacterium arenosum]|uniref:16S rRNA (guanine(527)-N(7))-methyltransferase RsmG n=1 Tax=Marinobacterium arenosum TaxID=2862496 RepID=UPI001C98A969|nr:16S rRNA (guanine(527)-N(7))-methyltransferase RsmG [Marinobacterium arenosum]MBY4676570.1 16S rRNA (guanine(527)-N(7))-methyltransferase RsmG [Marinobacterium arenosum]
MEQQLKQRLERGIDKLGLTLGKSQVEQLLAYLQLLIKWNQAYNLTAVRDPLEMVDRHLIDSLSVLPYIQDEPLIDVGSGPGLPGIPVAICKPDIAVTTLDSNGKKTRFQLQVKAQLGLDNLTVIQSRVEQADIAPARQVISRAFASLADMINWCQALCSEDGIFIAMKGLYPDDELAQLPPGYRLQASHRLQVPGTEGERHLLIVGRS